MVASHLKKSAKSVSSEPDDYDLAEPVEMSWIDLRKLKQSPLGTSALSPEQIDRAGIICMQLAHVYPDKREDWLDGFSRDSNPEPELRVWEHITKAYLTIEEVEFASDGLKLEAFSLLLMRSWTSTEDVLDRISLKYFSYKSAKRLLHAYELKPKPLVVIKIKSMQ